MKTLLIIVLVCLSGSTLCAIEKGSIPFGEIIIGRNLITNVDIIAKKYIFPGKIDQWIANDSATAMTMQLGAPWIKITGDTIREKRSNNYKKILQFDLLDQQIHWGQDFDSHLTTFDHLDRALLTTTGNLTSCLNYDTGDNLWSARNAICYVNSSQRIAAGFRYKGEELTSDLEGYNANTGELIWRRPIDRFNNMTGIFQLNDSVMVVLADGIHAVHLKTGAGWDYNVRSVRKDYTNSIISNLFNIVFSIIFRSNVYLTVEHDVITDLASNTLQDSTGFYLADMKKIVHLNDRGKVLWKKSLSMVSRSSLFFKDDLIYMVNHGIASYNYELSNYGKPFIAAFYKNSGKQVFLSRVGYKNERILSYEIQQDTLYVLATNHIFKYSLKDGSEIWEKKVNKDSTAEFIQFEEPELFIRSDSTYIKPILTNPTHLVVSDSKNQLQVLNNQLEVTTIIPRSNICNCYLKTNENNFYAVGEKTVVTDKSNTPVAVLDISGDTGQAGTKLFDVMGNTLLEIDMNQLPYLVKE